MRNYVLTWMGIMLVYAAGGHAIGWIQWLAFMLGCLFLWHVNGQAQDWRKFVDILHQMRDKKISKQAGEDALYEHVSRHL